MHLLVVWYLVNLQDARCNNKDNYVTYIVSGFELGRMDTDRIILAEDRDGWRVFVQTVTKLRVP